MNAFVNAINNTPVAARTANGMKAQENTLSSVVDFFYAVGTLRRASDAAIQSKFDAAYDENPDLALRIAQYARDIRGGQGERKVFRQILKWLELHQPHVLLETNFLANVPKIGRWDDLLVFVSEPVRAVAFKMISDALNEGNGLCAKWMPRKGNIAYDLRQYMGLSPKEYRRTLVRLTKVVETKMCAKDWDGIVYGHVPSVAMSRYMTAFHKNDGVRFQSYKDSLVKGTAKVNASAVYPYDVTRMVRLSADDVVANAMWKALPDYVGDAKILPIVDVSGSMSTAVANNLSALDVSVSLGLYLATKNTGAFKDIFVEFSTESRFVKLKGSTLRSKIQSISTSNWQMSTDLNKAFQNLLDFAVKNDVPAEDMPSTLLILSDMQFNQCSQYDDSAMQMIRRKYEKAGYAVPTIVFWNIAEKTRNAPVSYNEKGVALVSGFSPSIMKAVLAQNSSTIDPLATVREAVEIGRYDYK